MKASNVFLIAVIAIVAVSSALITATFLPSGSNKPEAMGVKANVLIRAIHPDGTVFAERVIHNVIVNYSKNNTIQCMIMNLNCTQLNNFTFIAVGNTSAPTDASVALTGEMASGGGCGLGRNGSNAVVVDTSKTVANASASYQWTAAGSCIANTTGLFNTTTSGVMLAGTSFSSVTLASGDKLNITWWIAVT